MTSIRHNRALGIGPSDQSYLDATRETILAVGWKRTTLTDVARRAGVSRMTLYRRWPDMQALLADLLVRDWGGLVAGAMADAPALPEAVVAAVRSIREDELFLRVVEVDPELLLPYLLQRRGRNQDHVLDLLTAGIADAQGRGEARSGDPGLLARTLLLALQGFVVSTATMTDTPTERLDTELRTLIERYLAP